jgi:hypothetical protein
MNTHTGEENKAFLTVGSYTCEEAVSLQDCLISVALQPYLEGRVIHFVFSSVLAWQPGHCFSILFMFCLGF